MKAYGGVDVWIHNQTGVGIETEKYMGGITGTHLFVDYKVKSRSVTCI
jgi:hypothetical protein